jgi:uncharacterized RDD family membrane protein YckC
MPGASEPLDTIVAIETPEHIVFHYRLAGPARRALAYLVDIIICYAIVIALAIFVLLVAAGDAVKSGEITGAAKAGFGLVLVVAFLTQWAYFVVWEAIYGRSPGKAIAGIRVLTTSGRPIGWRAAALRNLLRAADGLPLGYVVGLASIALTSRFQRLGDLVAGTMIVVPENAKAARPLELWPRADPRELQTLPDDVVLDADERAAIELFLRRRYTLGHLREHELACMIARPIGDRLGFRHDDPARLLALVYDRAVNAGRTEAPPSSFRPKPKKKEKENTKGEASWR